LAQSVPLAGLLAFRHMNATPEVKNIVLVHGGFVDGSGWQGVYDHLTVDGYRVAVVQNPTISLAGDVAVTRQTLDGLDGPAVLVGHSYGGAVISQAGNHSNVAAAEAFQRLGATPWEARANRELRATGVTVAKADTGLASLTPQQRQIALLAAAGHTNKEIAARLFLSPRTVSTHLYQVFPKLGITSRAALRDALADTPFE
jgi:DNA-binding CsgD family transcriptional regulator